MVEGRKIKADTLQRVELTEGVEIQLHTAGPYIRALAWLVDACFRTAIFIGVFIVLGLSGYFLGSNVAEGLFLLIFFLIEWFYFVFFEAFKHGATPGKRMFKLRVVQPTGLPITWSQAIIRNFLRVVDFLPFAYGFGLVACATNSRFQRLGDMAADTLVVYDECFHPRMRAMNRHFDPVAPTFAMNREEQQAMISFLEQGAILSDSRKEELAGIVAPIINKRGRVGVEHLFSIASWLRDSR